MKLLTGIVTLFLFAFTMIQAQEESPSATPAPTKTPLAEISDETTPEANTTTTSGAFEPFTQADLAVLTGNVQRPNGLLWFEDRIFSVCNGDWTVYELQDDGSETITHSYGVRNAHSLYIESVSETSSNIDLWIPDYDMNAIVRVSGRASPVTITEIEGPWGIAYLNEEQFLVTSLLENAIYLVDRAGEHKQLIGELRSPTGIVIHEETVFVSNNGSSRRSIEWISVESLLEGDNPSTQPLVSGLQNPTSLVMGYDGYLYFAYALGTRGVIGRVDPSVCMDSGCSNDQVEIVLYSDLPAPLAGLTVAPDMRIYVHTIYRPEIYWVQIPPENPSDG